MRATSSRPTSPCCGSSATSSAAAPSAPCSRIARRHRAGREQRRLRRRRQLRVLPEPARRQLPRRHPVGGRRRRTISATAASSTTTPIATACRLERLEVAARLPARDRASCAAPTSAATSPWGASARGRATSRTVRKLTAQASLNYTTNNGDRLDTREQVGNLQTEFTNSDVFGVTYTDSFERLVRPFAIAPGIVIAPGPYDFRTWQVSYTAGQQRRYLGPARLRPGDVLQRQPPLDRAQHRPPRGHPAAVARAELLGQRRHAAGRVVHGHGRPLARSPTR